MKTIERRRMMGGKALPYDAEVEYLETLETSSSKMWIDINVMPFRSDVQTFSFTLKATPTRFYNYNTLFGSSYDADSHEGWVYNTGQHTERIFYTSYIAHALTSGTPIVETVTFNRNAKTLQTECNGVTYAAKTITQSMLDTRTGNYLFYLGKSGSSYNEYKWYYFSMDINGELVRDLIPVRIGQTGYMYDKVSGQLFGNSGTGSFILGPDVMGGGKHLVINDLCRYLGERRAA